MRVPSPPPELFTSHAFRRKTPIMQGKGAELASGMAEIETDSKERKGETVRRTAFLFLSPRCLDKSIDISTTAFVRPGLCCPFNVHFFSPSRARRLMEAVKCVYKRVSLSSGVALSFYRRHAPKTTSSPLKTVFRTLAPGASPSPSE